MDRSIVRTTNGGDYDGDRPKPQKPVTEPKNPSLGKSARSSMHELEKLQTMLYLEKTEVGAMEALLMRSDISDWCKTQIKGARRLKHDAITAVEAIVKEEIEDRRSRLAAAKRDPAPQRRSLEKQLAALNAMCQTQNDSPPRQRTEACPSATRDQPTIERRLSRSAELSAIEAEKPRRRSADSTVPRQSSGGQRAHLRASSTPQVAEVSSREPSNSSSDRRSTSSKLSVRTEEAPRSSAAPGGLIRHGSLPPRYPSTSALTSKGSGSPASQGSSSRTTGSPKEGRRSRDGEAGTKSVGFDFGDMPRRAGPGSSGGSGDFSRFGTVAELLEKRRSKKMPEEEGASEARRRVPARNGNGKL